MTMNRTSFKPGQSGNPKGKPPGKNVSAVIRKRCGDRAERIVAEWEAIAFGPAYQGDVHARLKALDKLIERGYGKVPDVVEHGAGDGVRNVRFILEVDGKADEGGG